MAATTVPEDKLGDVQHNAQELGIDMDHVKETKGADKMFAYASADAIEIDEATNKKLVRKIDLNVLPWLCVLYILQYLDKGVYVYFPMNTVMASDNYDIASLTLESWVCKPTLVLPRHNIP